MMTIMNYYMNFMKSDLMKKKVIFLKKRKWKIYRKMWICLRKNNFIFNRKLEEEISDDDVEE